jgi:hypothetical protein
MTFAKPEDKGHGVTLTPFPSSENYGAGSIPIATSNVDAIARQGSSLHLRDISVRRDVAAKK